MIAELIDELFQVLYKANQTEENDADTWEKKNIELLTSKEMGEWLARRDNRIFAKIEQEIKQERDCVLHTPMNNYTPNNVIDVIDYITSIIERHLWREME